MVLRSRRSDTAICFVLSMMCNHPSEWWSNAKGENMSGHPSRRQILRSTLASSGLGLAIGYPALTFAQSAAPTLQCHDADEATIRQTEGPYFKPSSPQRADLVEPDTKITSSHQCTIDARASFEVGCRTKLCPCTSLQQQNFLLSHHGFLPIISSS